MKYISGKYALNIPCSLKTAGDWHHNSFPIEKANYFDSSNSIFKNYGIEKHIINNKEYNVANHLRAILDLISTNDFEYLKGFKNDFIVVDDYNKELFKMVLKLRDNKNWVKINKLMKNEYMNEWINYLK